MNRLVCFFMALSITLTGLSVNVVYAEEGVAKVMMLKGEAKAKTKDGKEVAVKKDQWIQEGSILKTSAKSFVKLLFIDKSQMNLGPDSQMEIAKFPKQEAGVINLVTGSLRSKVTKDYMDNKDTDKSKLIVKTKTAAMGVRGTDFQVSFDPGTQATGLDVWEGQVMMAKIDPAEVALPAASIDNILNKEGVPVKEGSEAVADPKSSAPPEVKPMPADKMDAGKSDTVVQTDTGKKDEAKKEEGGSNTAKSETKVEGKAEAKTGDASKTEAPKAVAPTVTAPVVAAPKGDGMRDIIPPGVPKSNFTNEGSGAAAALSSVAGTAAVASADKAVATTTSSSDGGGRAPASVPSGPDITPLALPPTVHVPILITYPVDPFQFGGERDRNNSDQQTQTQNTIIQNNIGTATTTDVTISVSAQ